MVNSRTVSTLSIIALMTWISIVTIESPKTGRAHEFNLDEASALPSPTVALARPRAREAGVVIGVLPAGPLNAITDVSGVAVGHTTLITGDNVRTGVTAILPHGGNLFRE